MNGIENELPQGWVVTTLGDVSQPFRARENPKSYPRLPFIGMEHIEAHSMRLLGTVPASTMKSNAVHFFPNDVLYGRLRPYLNKVYRPDFEGLCSSEFIVFPASDLLNAKFLQYFLNSSEFVSFAAQLNAGDRPRIDFSQIKTYEFRLPPLAEQTRIVAKVEELFTQLDAGVEELRKAQAQLKRYRQAVLKAAVTGELTREWREAHKDELEPASELLARILKERRAKWEKDQLARMTASGKTQPSDDWKKKYTEPKSPELDAIELPRGWIYASAEQLTSVITDGEHITPERANSGVLLLSARNIHNGALSLDKVDYISESIYQNLAKRLTINPGDVLLSCSGTVGRSCVAPTNLRFALVRSVAVLKPILQIGSFISYALRSPHLQAQIQEKKTQTAQANIFQGKIKKLVFSLPSLVEQQKIVEEVELLMSIADNSQRTIEAGIMQAERLRQSILKQAFEGKLVSQDPNDEPAELLLERIKLERAKREAEKRAEAKPNRKRVTRKRPKRTERPAA